MYAPQQIVYLLTATTLARDPQNVKIALAVHVASWLFQFYGHGVHEGRAPALLDNIVGGEHSISNADPQRSSHADMINYYVSPVLSALLRASGGPIQARILQ